MIAVANGGREIRLFDSNGSFIRTDGGLGDGPAEFRVLLRLVARENVLMVMDSGRRRVVAFDVEGRVVDAYSTNWSGLFAMGGMAAGDDRVFALTLDQPTMASENGQARYASDLVVLKPGRRVDTLRTLEGPMLSVP